MTPSSIIGPSPQNPLFAPLMHAIRFHSSWPILPFIMADTSLRPWTLPPHVRSPPDHVVPSPFFPARVSDGLTHRVLYYWSPRSASFSSATFLPPTTYPPFLTSPSPPRPQQDSAEPERTRITNRYRQVYTPSQLAILEQGYSYDSYITIQRRADLARSVGLSQRQVKIWFQNRRQKARLVALRSAAIHARRTDFLPTQCEHCLPPVLVSAEDNPLQKYEQFRIYPKTDHMQAQSNRHSPAVPQGE